MARTDADRSPLETAPAKQPSRFVLAGLAGTVIAVCAAIKTLSPAPEAVAQAPVQQGVTPATAGHSSTATQPPAAYQPPEHDVMAIVNGQDINRDQLAQACVERFGEDVLESLVNKRLIEHRCRNRGITVTEQDLEAEVDKIAKRFKLDREQWLGLLEKERGVKPEEYKRDILWPTIALRRLAGKEVQVSEDELRQAYETRFGPKVQVRLIVLSSGERAAELHRQLVDRPDDFARLAMQESEDVNSASIGGLIQPIRLHMGDPILEQAAFALEEGQVSSVLQVENQFAILKCEQHLRARRVDVNEVRGQLEQQIKEDKLRQVAGTVFEQVQATATVQNVFNDPSLRNQMPGVVATVNGEPISMRELGVECLARHGQPVLESEISRTLLQQELKRAGQAVSQADLETEMAHAAVLAGVTNQAGAADLPRWIKQMTDEQDVAYEVYLRDSVWPSAALKKLTQGKVEVTREDLAKGYEANYGPRVRCRAIVLPNMRRAQEVWAKARENTSLEYFGDLAAEYSIEPTSKTLRGEVPPLRKHGGQPQLENAAFSLADGEMSGIVQVGDKFVILRCEGRTTPVAVDPGDAEINRILSQDIFEKKLRVAMAATYDEVKTRARIDNYLAGTSQAPPAKRDAAVRQTSGVR